MNNSQQVRFAVDTGGTFTDIVVFNESDGTFTVDKVPTTPQNTLFGVLNVIEKAGVVLATVSRFFIHGSTTGLNALIERKGVRTAYVTTKGFRDVPEIARYNRPEMYNPKYHKPPQLVPRELRFEVTERMNTDGEVLKELDVEDVRRVAKAIRKKDVKAIAVCFLHAFKNPAHEREVKRILLEDLPEVAIAISSDIVSEHREYERSMTTILSAYLAPVVETWIEQLESELAKQKFKGKLVLTKSDGGGMTGEFAKESPINTLLSGPAGGVIGGLYVALNSDYTNLITMDMGGTSFDVGMIKDCDASTSQETKASGYSILIPNLDIRTIGAGGGSIAEVDSLGALHVGPQSAGAEPGPICYAKGGVNPTVTDAAVCNGYINPKHFLGGEMSLDVDAAKRGIEEKVSKPLGITLEKGAAGIMRIALSNMAEAIKDITSEMGDDPRDFALLCYGGGGPMFGPCLMEDLSVPAAIVPVAPANFSAWGMLMVDLRHDVVMTVTKKLERIDIAELVNIFSALRNKADELLAKEGVDQSARKFYQSVDMRYTGQEHSVPVPVEFDLNGDDAKEQLYAEFQRVYDGVYGYTLKNPADVVNVRIKAIGEIPKPKLRDIESGGEDPNTAFKESRRVFDFIQNEWLEYGCYDRSRLLANNIVKGPAIIEEATTLTAIRPQQQCQVDRHGNLIIT